MFTLFFDLFTEMLDNNLETMLDYKDGVTKVNIAGAWYDFDCSDLDIQMVGAEHNDLGYESGDSEQCKVPSELFSDEEDTTKKPKAPSPPKKKPANRRAHGSTSSDSGNEGEDAKSNRGRKPGQCKFTICFKHEGNAQANKIICRRVFEIFTYLCLNTLYCIIILLV